MIRLARDLEKSIPMQKFIDFCGGDRLLVSRNLNLSASHIYGIATGVAKISKTKALLIQEITGGLILAIDFNVGKRNSNNIKREGEYIKSHSKNKSELFKQTNKSEISLFFLVMSKTREDRIRGNIGLNPRGRK